MKIKKEVDVDPVTSTEDYVYLPSPDASNFVHETARQVKLNFYFSLSHSLFFFSLHLLIFNSFPFLKP